MAKTRSNNEGNIKLRSDGRYEVRVTVDYDKMTGQSKRVSKYAKTKEEAVKLLNQMSFMNDTSPNIIHAVAEKDMKHFFFFLHRYKKDSTVPFVNSKSWAVISAMTRNTFWI